MAEETIKITVGADTSQLNAELTKAQNNLKLFQQALAKSTNVDEIKYLQRNIGALENKIGSLSSSLGGKFVSASGQATNTLTNLSRVAQDAPYGFIGIANNINPLVESFGRLQTETGSLKGAFTSLLSSLTGPAGIGLAFGVISSLLVTFGGSLFGSKKNVEELDDSLQRTKDTLQSVKDDFNNFIAVADSAKSLNDINIKLRFKDEGTQNALIRQSEFINISEKYVQAVDKSKQALENYQNIKESDYKTQQDYNSALNSAFKIYQDLSTEEINLLNAREKQAATNRLATEEEKRLAAERIAVADSIEKTLAKLREDLKDQVNIGIAFNTTTISQRVGLYESTIKKLITDFNLSPDSKTIIGLTTELNEAKFVKDLIYNSQKAQLLVVKSGLGQIKVPILPEVDINKPIPLKGFQLDQSQLDTLNGVLTSTAQDIAINFGETLGAALSGQASIGDFFSGMFQQIGKGMQQFGKYMIQFAIKVKAIKEWAIAHPALAIAGGIALIALGALLQAQTEKKQAFAVGTNYAPGGMALVGERGPEMVSLPRGARVTPAAQTAQMMGGAMQQVEVFGTLRGQDIYFSNKKYSQTYRRTT